jgi:hypothetical protein
MSVEISLPDPAWVVLVSDSEHNDGGKFVSWHETEREAEDARASLQGGGPPYYHVEKVSRGQLEAFLSNPPR